ncbi:DM13 domain-containing protein [Pseudahrensia aquimaris]|uniref:DM13 domain-containing protein n=1 Tax=Pseudahrensia aquimaris TaxID=744461 RepID=A0ABW3FIP4_9HYPH
MRIILAFFTHGAMLAIGFALGIYFLPILTAPPAPDSATLQQQAAGAQYTANFTRQLPGSDFLHWGEGKISISGDKIVHEGKLAPGPDYRLYLAPDFADHEDPFNAIKEQAIEIGSVKTFNGFVLDVPDGIDVSSYNSVIIWCETFGEFITAAKYR